MIEFKNQELNKIMGILDESDTLIYTSYLIELDTHLIKNKIEINLLDYSIKKSNNYNKQVLEFGVICPDYYDSLKRVIITVKIKLDTQSFNTIFELKIKELSLDYSDFDNLLCALTKYMTKYLTYKKPSKNEK